MAKEYDFDSYLAEARPTEFVLRVASDRTIIIEPPDVETLLKLDEARTARRTLELLCGQRWSEVFELIKAKHPGALEKLSTDIRRHFNLEGEPAGGGRAS